MGMLVQNMNIHLCSTKVPESIEIGILYFFSPLISNKQEEEKISMLTLQDKQNTTDNQLRKAREKLDQVERNFEQAKRESDQEERYLAERLLSLSNELKIAQYIYSYLFHTVVIVSNL